MPRIIEGRQGTDEWDRLRCGIPTASQIHRIITPARGQLSAQHLTYACELVAKSLNVWDEPLPTFAMQRGTDLEPDAVACYERLNGLDVRTVCFVYPDDTTDYGCSPDGLVGDVGMLEVKCPSVTDVIRYNLEGVSDADATKYKCQVQSQLMICDREWCDLWFFHECPDLVPPVAHRVYRDNRFIEKMKSALEEFCEVLNEIRIKMGVKRG